MSLPIASLSLDLDNKWSYLRVHGDPGWDSFPSYFDIVVPRILDFLEARDLRITFFVVGQDAALTRNHCFIKLISEAGHEIASHSFSHEPWMHLYGRERLEWEIVQTEEHIRAIVGRTPRGFRGPGFSFPEAAIDILERRGYVYDASSFPSYFGPLARFYYLLRSNLSAGDLQERKLLFGSLRDGWRPLNPHRWFNTDLLEIPVSTFPVLRSPIHLSYILFLSQYSPRLALEYFRSALRVYRAFGLSPSLLLHPLDFLGLDDYVGLDFFPAMRLPREDKIRVVSAALKLYCDEYKVVPLLDHAHAIKNQSPVPIVDDIRGGSKNRLIMKYVAPWFPMLSRRLGTSTARTQRKAPDQGVPAELELGLAALSGDALPRDHAPKPLD